MGKNEFKVNVYRELRVVRKTNTPKGFWIMKKDIM